MATPKIALAAPETIPLDKLEIHEDNVRKAAEAKGAIEDLAADIAARGLLQSLSVRPILDSGGKETGRYGVQAGGRRFLRAETPRQAEEACQERAHPLHRRRRTASPRQTASPRTRSAKR